MADSAQGINKTFAYKKQIARGTPATGAGGQLLRRETAMMMRTADTYNNNEIASHQQYTGDQQGIKRSSGTLSGLLSGGTYADHVDSILRRNRTDLPDLTGLALTLAASGNLYTITRQAGSFLADLIKLGMVVRLDGMNAANNGVNLAVLGVTATTLTVSPLNGKVLIPEGPITGASVLTKGKGTWVPTSGHTNDYYTFEEWFGNIGRSHLFADVQIATMEIGIPASGNVTFSESYVGLGSRVKSDTQKLTNPSAETTSAVVAAVAGAVVIAGKRRFAITSATITIDGGVAPGEATLGSAVVSDTQKGRIKVSGQFTGIYEDDDLAAPFDSGAAVPLVIIVAADTTDAAEFISFAMPEVKLFGDNADDGEKQIIRTYPFTGQIANSGGPVNESLRTILQVHDSLAL